MNDYFYDEAARDELPHFFLYNGLRWIQQVQERPIDFNITGILDCTNFKTIIFQKNMRILAWLINSIILNSIHIITPPLDSGGSLPGVIVFDPLTFFNDIILVAQK